MCRISRFTKKRRAAILIEHQKNGCGLDEAGEEKKINKREIYCKETDRVSEKK